MPRPEGAAPVASFVGSTARSRSREPECALPAAARAGSAFIGGAALTGPAGLDRLLPGRRRIPPWSATRTRADHHRPGQRRVHDQPAPDRGRQRRAGHEPAPAQARHCWLVAPESAARSARGPGESLRPDARRDPWAVVHGRRGVAGGVLAGPAARPGRGRAAAGRGPGGGDGRGPGPLYRARRARDRAAAALRGRLPTGSRPGSGCPRRPGRTRSGGAIAVRTGQEPAVGGALYGPPPADDAGLVALAGYLDIFERKVGNS